MADGGVYTVAMTDATSRTYTFGCSGVTKYKPANAPTTASTTTLYTLNGMMDEVAVWSTKLTATEIKSIFLRTNRARKTEVSKATRAEPKARVHL